MGGLLVLQAGIAAVMLAGWSPWKDFDNGRAAYNEGLELVRSALAGEARGEAPALVLVDSFLLEAGQPQRAGDYFIYSVLLANGRRDPAPLLNDLAQQRYGLIITEVFNRWPPSIETALSRAYNLRTLSGRDGQRLYLVYTRR